MVSHNIIYGIHVENVIKYILAKHKALSRCLIVLIKAKLRRKYFSPLAKRANKLNHWIDHNIAKRLQSNENNSERVISEMIQMYYEQSIRY